MKRFRIFEEKDGRKVIINLNMVSEVLKSKDEGFINVFLNIINEDVAVRYSFKGTLESFMAKGGS